MNVSKNEEDEKKEYRSLLISTAQKSQDAYDKTILTLSGGALGISFAFFKQIAGESPASCPGYLITAWVFWGASVTAVLFSFLCSHAAQRHAIKQFDSEKIHSERPGGWFDRITIVLNMLSGFLFLGGVIFIIVFIYKNMR